MADYSLYRLSDRVFWAVLGIGVLFCVVHAARRLFRHPQPTGAASLHGVSPGIGGEEVGRYTALQRLFHWVNLFSMGVLLVSGLAIYLPGSLISLNRPAFFWFAWHRWFTALFLITTVFHIVYDGFVIDRISNMWLGRGEVHRLTTVLKNFFGLTKDYPLYGKYHPAQIIYHWTLSANLLALSVSGFVLWKPFRDLLPLSLFGLGWEFIYYNRILHDFFTATLTASLAGHVYFALLKKNWAELKSMFTGKISLAEYRKSHQWPEES